MQRALTSSPLRVMALLVCGALLPFWAAAISSPASPSATAPAASSGLQIAPLEEGLPAHAGKTAKVRVLLNGLPVACVSVWVELLVLHLWRTCTSSCAAGPRP